MKKLLPWINNLNNIFWSGVVKSTNVDVKSLCVFRIITGVFLLCIYCPSFSWIANFPQAFFDPPFLSLANLIHRFPAKEFFMIIDLILLITAVFITLGIKAKISTFIYAFTSIIGFNFQFSFGKIDHTILLPIMLFCMAFSGWGAHLAVVPDKVTNTTSTAKSLSLLSVLICFSFFSAGFSKAFNWINFDTNISGSAAWFYSAFYLHDQQRFLLAPFIKYLPFLSFKVMDFIAVSFELSPLLFLLTSRKAWRVWMMLACLFHILNTLILNINFIFNSIVYLAFADFTYLFQKIKYLCTLKLVKALIYACLSLITIVRINYSFNSIKSSNIFWPDHFKEFNLYFAVLIWIIVLMLLSKGIFQRTPKGISKFPRIKDIILSP